jgi:arginyl-tRNA synthetase
MATVYEDLLARFQAAVDALAPDVDPVLRPSEHGDYQVNGAMAIAKRLGTNPREIAQAIIDATDLQGVGRAEIAGPGFINVYLDGDFVNQHLSEQANDDRLGVAERESRTVVIDYSHPNVAKEMHVGHLRSTVIGDSLRRMKEFMGDVVIARNHIGDWGTNFGMLIEHLVDVGEDEIVQAFSIGDLDGFYRQARQKFNEDPNFADRSRRRVVLLQAGDAETLALWSMLVRQSTAYFEEVYRKLDVRLKPDEVVGESAYNDQLHAVLDDLKAAGLVVESEGAQCVFPPGFTKRDGEPLPLIIQKSDEGFGYAATDLAAVRNRVDVLGADDIYYVVGAPQAQHLEMVFATARMAGWLPDSVCCEHVPFGNVLGPDRKMFKSREGGTVRLIALIDEAVERADEQLAQRDPELDGDTRHALAYVIARAALKYADLSNERQKDYVFDLDRMVSFEGDTGPYLCYAHARIRSIFRRLSEPWMPETVSFTLAHPAERALAMVTLRFPEALDAASDQLAPHKLCAYLFELAQAFTAFYEACPVLKSEGATRQERLALCDLVAKTLSLGLDLLGITAPERM